MIYSFFYFWVCAFKNWIFLFLFSVYFYLIHNKNFLSCLLCVFFSFNYWLNRFYSFLLKINKLKVFRVFITCCVAVFVFVYFFKLWFSFFLLQISKWTTKIFINYNWYGLFDWQAYCMENYFESCFVFVLVLVLWV